MSFTYCTVKIKNCFKTRTLCLETIYFYCKFILVCHLAFFKLFSCVFLIISLCQKGECFIGRLHCICGLYCRFCSIFLLSSKYIPMINTYKQAAAPVKMFIICASVLSMVPKETSMERCKVKMDAAASA